MRISVFMEWFEHGYALLWAMAAPTAREMITTRSASEHHEFVSGAVVEMP